MGPIVLVPWRQDSSPRRRAALTRVLDHLRAGRLSARTVSPPIGQEWSPGAARNHGVELYRSFDPIVFNDADTLVPHEQIRSAIALAADETGGLVYAYDLYLRLDERGKTERELYAPPSMGCAAINRASFEALGGFDETYLGWGYEDCDFARRAAPVRRVTGVAQHIWHGDRRQDDSPMDSDRVLVLANLDRFLRAS